jgi:hypothetical protein
VNHDTRRANTDTPTGPERFSMAAPKTVAEKARTEMRVVNCILAGGCLSG